MKIKKIIRKKIVIVILFIFIIVCAGNNNIQVYSKTNNQLSVSTVIPDNQIDKRQTYFDLKMQPNQEQIIQVILKNSGNKKITANVKINAASTGRNGSINYNIKDIRDESMTVSITDIASLESELVSIPAKSSTTVNIYLKMPAKEFDGVVLGGIVISEEEPQNNKHNSESNIVLKNEFTSIIGLKLSENDKVLVPDFELVNIKASVVNYRTCVIAVLRNKMPIIAKNMVISANVYKANSNTVLHSLTLDNAEMAPSSTGDFVIDWNSYELQSGTYRLEMDATYKDNTWSWNEEFTIGDVNELNKQGLWLNKNNIWPYILAGVIALIVVGFSMYYLGRYKSNGKK